MNKYILLLSATALTFGEIHANPEHYMVTDQVFFDVNIDDVYAGRIVLGLFGETVPKTVKNFLQIATTGIDGKTYAGTKFHRAVERFMIQGGDIVNDDGSGSVSIYGKYFDDENFEVKHTGPGLLSMANAGPNTNGCQFFITTIATPWLDGKHTVFGKVIQGQGLVHKIEHLKTDVNDRPNNLVVIVKSGLIPTVQPFAAPSYEITFWAWIKAGWFPLSFSLAILAFFHWVMIRLDVEKIHVD